MEVLDYGPQAWYLLRDEQELYLDVNCNHSFVGYSFTMQLNREEAAKYQRHGRAYLDQLAQAVQYSAPGVSASQSIYKDRLVEPEVSARANDAIRLWRWRAPAPYLRGRPLNCERETPISLGLLTVSRRKVDGLRDRSEIR
ncbi:hypothetical protein ACI2VA_04250 [Ralstonia nicotianae]